MSPPKHEENTGQLLHLWVGAMTAVVVERERERGTHNHALPY